MPKRNTEPKCNQQSCPSTTEVENTIREKEMQIRYPVQGCHQKSLQIVKGVTYVHVRSEKGVNA